MGRWDITVKIIMKKILSLMISASIAGCIYAQIEEFDAASFSQHDNKQTTISAVFNLQQYPIELRNGNDRTQRPFYLKGHRLYCTNTVGQVHNAPLIALTFKDGKTAGISRVRKGEYYDVVDILCSTEEKMNLLSKLNSTKAFVGDTVVYSAGNKEKQYIFKQKDVKPLTDQFERFNKSSRAVVYVLKDSYGKLFYVWFAEVWEIAAIDSKSYSIYGSYVSIEDFISVSTYNYLKVTFEGKEIVKSAYYDNQNPFDSRANDHFVFNAEKILLKDGAISITLYNKKNDTREVEPLLSYTWQKLGYVYKQKGNDSLQMLCTEKDCFVLRTEADSIITKWEQDAQKAERERIAKDERKKQELIQKYGEKYANDIMAGNATIGMTKEMCKQAIGSPDNITTSNNSLGTIEVWEYSRYHRYYPSLYPIIVVTFTNSKVSSVNKYENAVPF